MATATAHILAKMRECSLLWLNFTRVENEIIEKTGAREDNCKFDFTITLRAQDLYKAETTSPQRNSKCRILTEINAGDGFQL